MTDDLASQIEGLRLDKLAALFKHMNIIVVKQEDDRDYDSVWQFFPCPCQGQGGVFTLPSSLQLHSSSRTGRELGDVKVIIPKAYHGNTLRDRQKTMKIVTSPLSPAIVGSNIAKILSIADSESYDVAEDAS